MPLDYSLLRKDPIMASLADLLNPEFDPGCLFDELPEEVLEKIAGELIHQRSAKAIELTQYPPLKRAFGCSLEKIHFNDVMDEARVVDSRIDTGSFTSIITLEHILRELKPDVRMIQMQYGFNPAHLEFIISERATLAAEVIVRSCPNVRVLHIVQEEHSQAFEDAIAILIREYGPQLIEIELNRHEDDPISYMSAMSAHCTSLNSLTFTGYSLIKFSDLFLSVGDTLLEINICLIYGDENNWETIVPILGRDCRSLTQIILDDPLGDAMPITEGEYVSFLTSYGSQLESANTLSLSTEGCRRVANACPNLSVTTLETGLNYERLVALNTRLHTLWLEIAYQEGESKWFGMKYAMEHCTNLTYLTVETNGENGKIYDEWMPEMFAIPMCKLEELHIVGTLCVDARNLSIIAKATTQLTTFICNIDKLDELNVFDDLIHNNLHLIRVQIYISKRKTLRVAAVMAEQAAERFLNCKYLDTLKLKFGIHEDGHRVKIDASSLTLPYQFREIELDISTVILQ